MSTVEFDRTPFMLYLLVGLVVVGLGYFVAWPLLSTEKSASNAVQAHAFEANAHTAKESIEQTLADLEFDFATGKIDDEEYQTARAPLIAQIPDEPAETPLIDEWELEILIARARRKMQSVK